MSSFLEGVRVGQGIVQQGVDAYDRSRAWSDRLTERKEAKEAAGAARKLEADRHAESQSQRRQDDYTKSFQYDIERKEREADRAERKRHNERMENQWAPGSRGRGVGASGEITPKVAAAEAFKMLKGYSGDPKSMPEEEFNQYQSYLKIANPKHSVKTFKAKQGWWDSMFGGSKEPAAEAAPKYEIGGWRAASGYPGIK